MLALPCHAEAFVIVGVVVAVVVAVAVVVVVVADFSVFCGKKNVAWEFFCFSIFYSIKLSVT